MGIQSDAFINNGMSSLVSDLRGTINKYFSVEDVRWSEQAMAFYILPNEELLGENFDELRKELIPKGFIPTLVHEHNDHIIYVTKKPVLETRSVKVNIVMFILTVISTIWAGAVLWAPRTNYNMDSSNAGGALSSILGTITNPELVAYGALFFALPLMLILGIHELGHYFMSKRHGVDASLPFFIPIPPFVTPLGTLGAFISLREPMPNKKALMDIGAAGPIAGFIVALPVTLIGLHLTNAQPLTIDNTGEFETILGSPLVFFGLQMLVPIKEGLSIHPMAFAGWVGILVTSMNLLPAGQLDGGHIVRALFGNNSRYISYGVVIMLFGLGFMFAGWWIFTFLILILGTSHPPPLNDITKLTSKRKAIGAFTITMMVICFVPIPIIISEVTHPDFEIDVVDDEIIAGIGESINFTLTINNLGKSIDNYLIDIDITGLQNKSGNYSGSTQVKSYDELNGNTAMISNWVLHTDVKEITLRPYMLFRFYINAVVPPEADYGDNLTFSIRVKSSSDSSSVKVQELRVKVGELSFRHYEKIKRIHSENIVILRAELINTGTGQMTVELNTTLDIKSVEPANWPELVLNTTEYILEAKEKKIIQFEVAAPKEAKVGDYVIIYLHAQNKFDASVYDELSFKIIVD